jgi:hypothetical protein
MKNQILYDNIEVPENLENRLETLIDRLAEKEKQAKRKTLQFRLWIGSMAASVLLGATVFGLLNTEKKSVQQYGDWKPNVIEDPEIAFIEAQKALTLVSNNFNKGLNMLAMVSDEMLKSNERINYKLNKTLKK